MSSNGKFVPEKLRCRIYTRDQYRCMWCLTDVCRPGIRSEKSVATLDHVLPRAAGGSDLVSNLVTSCLSCNSRRQNTDPEAWALKISGSFQGALTIIARVCRAMGAEA